MEKQLEQFNNQYSVTDTGIVYSLKGKKKELIGKITKSGNKEKVMAYLYGIINGFIHCKRYEKYIT